MKHKIFTLHLIGKTHKIVSVCLDYNYNYNVIIRKKKILIDIDFISGRVRCNNTKIINAITLTIITFITS